MLKHEHATMTLTHALEYSKVHRVRILGYVPAIEKYVPISRRIILDTAKEGVLIKVDVTISDSDIMIDVNI